jgi:hypothetical protein
MMEQNEGKEGDNEKEEIIWRTNIRKKSFHIEFEYDSQLKI